MADKTTAPRTEMTPGSRRVVRKVYDEVEEAVFNMGEALGTSADTPEAVARKMISAEKHMDTAKRWLTRFLFINNLEYLRMPPGMPNSQHLEAAKKVIADTTAMSNSAPSSVTPSSAKESAATFMAKLYPQHKEDCNYLMYATMCNCGHEERVKDAIDGVEIEMPEFLRRNPEVSLSGSFPQKPRPESDVAAMCKPGYFEGLLQKAKNDNKSSPITDIQTEEDFI